MCFLCLLPFLGAMGLAALGGGGIFFWRAKSGPAAPDPGPATGDRPACCGTRAAGG